VDVPAFGSNLPSRQGERCATRAFVEADRAARSLPTDAGEPCSRTCNRRWLGFRYWRRACSWVPVFEPHRRRARIEPAALLRDARELGDRPCMLAIVEEHVDETITNVARRRERTPMMTIAKELPMPALDAIHLERDPREEVLKIARGTHAIVRLEDQMDVVVLHRVVQKTNPSPHGMRDLRLDRNEQALRAKARACRRPLHRHVKRMTTIVPGTSRVREQAGWHRRTTRPARALRATS
jgi:hypothetical protein